MGINFVKLYSSSLPADPIEIILKNHWQLTTYKIISQILNMKCRDLVSTIGTGAFTFYSFYYGNYVIAYNDEKDYKDILFYLAHEIGHILCGHISQQHTINLYIPIEERQSQDEQADEFAIYLLGK